jgi:hypothetical protein
VKVPSLIDANRRVEIPQHTETTSARVHNKLSPLPESNLGDADSRGGSSPSVQSVLSVQEKAALHLLFGSEKPDELNFYGRNRTDQIQVGQLIDITG